MFKFHLLYFKGMDQTGEVTKIKINILKQYFLIKINAENLQNVEMLNKGRISITDLFLLCRFQYGLAWHCYYLFTFMSILGIS